MAPPPEKAQVNLVKESVPFVPHEWRPENSKEIFSMKAVWLIFNVFQTGFETCPYKALRLTLYSGVRLVCNFKKLKITQYNLPVRK